MTKDKSIKLAVDLKEKLFTQNEQYIKNLEKEIDDLRRQQRQRQWVGLTDDEIDSIGLKSAPPVHPDFLHDDDWHEFSRAIEAKLREKNT